MKIVDVNGTPTACLDWTAAHPSLTPPTEDEVMIAKVINSGANPNQTLSAREASSAVAALESMCVSERLRGQESGYLKDRNCFLKSDRIAGISEKKFYELIIEQYVSVGGSMTLTELFLNNADTLLCSVKKLDGTDDFDIAPEAKQSLSWLFIRDGFSWDSYISAHREYLDNIEDRAIESARKRVCRRRLKISGVDAALPSTGVAQASPELAAQLVQQRKARDQTPSSGADGALGGHLSNDFMRRIAEVGEATTSGIGLMDNSSGGVDNGKPRAKNCSALVSPQPVHDVSKDEVSAEDDPSESSESGSSKKPRSGSENEQNSFTVEE